MDKFQKRVGLLADDVSQLLTKEPGLSFDLAINLCELYRDLILVYSYLKKVKKNEDI